MLLDAWEEGAGTEVEDERSHNVVPDTQYDVHRTCWVYMAPEEGHA